MSRAPYNKVEERIQKHLAANLGLLESHLKLIDEKYRITYGKNWGEIDILARDRANVFVIIEIKRSRQTAREAMQEAHKYAELLHRVHGVGPEDVRIIIAATEWSDLILAFSNMVRTVPYHVTGYELKLENEVPRAAVKVNPLPAARPIGLAMEHGIYLFSDAASRDNALTIIQSDVHHRGLDDCVIFALDYTGENPLVVHRYAFYLVPGYIDEERRSTILKHVSSSYGLNAEDVTQSHVLREALVGVHHALRKANCPNYCEYADGTASIIATMLKDWTVAKTIRGGRFAAQGEELFSDNHLCRMAAHIDGGNRYGFSWCGNSDHRAMWARMETALTQFMQHNVIWGRHVKWFLELENLRQDNTFLSIDVVDFFDPLRAIDKYASTGDDALVPQLMATAELPDGSKLMLLGGLVWDSETLPSLNTVLPGRGNLSQRMFSYLLQLGNDSAPGTALEIVERHGITYSSVFGKIWPDGTDEGYLLICRADDSVEQLPIERQTQPVLDDFCADPRNAQYLLDLHRLLSTVIVG